MDKVQSKGILVELCHRLRLVQWDHKSCTSWLGSEEKNDEDETEGPSEKKLQFARAVLMYHFTLRPSELETLSSLPLYPDESLLWNPHLVPPGNLMVLSQLEGQSNTLLALPKMNVQFLTFGDYLLRDFPMKSEAILWML